MRAALGVLLLTLTGGCAAGGENLRGSTAPLGFDQPGPYRRGVYGPIDSPWRELTVEAVVLPWHRAVLGGYPRSATATFGMGGFPTADGGPVTCPFTPSSGEVDLYTSNGVGPWAGTLSVHEYLPPDVAAETSTRVYAGRALANGWTEYVARASGSTSLFARPGMPWVCASGDVLRERVRAALQSDPRLPTLTGLPRDIAYYKVTIPCVLGACSVEIERHQLDEDARVRAETIGRTRRFPPSAIGQTFHWYYPNPAQAAAAAIELRAVPDTCGEPVQRGAELFRSCTRRTPGF